MELTIQAKKRQKCFMIDPKDGAVQFVPTFTAEEEQSFAISQLELWKKAGLADGKEVMDANHIKLLQFQDIAVRNVLNDSEEKSDAGLKQEKLKNAFESAQRAAAELSMLVQLTNLIASNKILSLQTCYDSNVLSEANEDQEHEPSASKTAAAPKVIPLAQIIGIQRESMSKAQVSLQSGLDKMKRLVQQRNAFAETLRTCTEDKSFVLCYVDRKSNKRVLNRKYDPRKDYIAVDCSIATDTTPKDAKDTSKAVLLPPTDVNQPLAGAKAVSTYVPIHMDKAGLALSEDEQNAHIYTLQAQLILRNEFSNQPAVAGSVRSWDVLHPTGTSSSTNEENTTASLAQHFQRRKHETLCKMVFAQLKDECIRGSTQWDLLGGVSETAIGQLSTSKEWAKLQTALREETILQSIVVVDVQESSVLLRVGAWLQLSVSLVPIGCNTGALTAAAGREAGQDAGGKWVHDALASMLLQSLLGVLRPAVAVTASSLAPAPAPAVQSASSHGSIADVESAIPGVSVSAYSGGADYWSKVISKKGAAKGGAGEQGGCPGIAHSMLSTLRGSVEKLRAPAPGSASAAMDIA